MVIRGDRATISEGKQIFEVGDTRRSTRKTSMAPRRDLSQWARYQGRKVAEVANKPHG
jgi:hypothetical protein